MINNEEFISEFVEEATGHIFTLEQELLKLDQGEITKDGINTIFRSVHSIKGTAGFFALDKIVGLAHVMENLFGEIRNDRISVTSIIADTMLRANDCLKGMIENVSGQSTVDISEHLDAINRILSNEEPSNIKESQTIVDSLKAYEEVVGKLDNVGVDILKDSIKRGHKVYRLSLSINKDMEERGITPVQFFKKVRTIGNLLYSETDISEIGGLESFMDEEIYIKIYVTSVLERSLLALALGMDTERILQYHEADDTVNEEIDVKPRVDEVKQEELPQKQENGKVDKENIEIIDKPKDDSIRVNVNLLNDLLNLASEMVLGRNQLLRLMEEHRKRITGIDPVLQNIDFITTELQGKIMQTRMQPVGNVFNKFPRIVREISKNLGKEVDLIIEGADVELDKSIIEALGDPITHLIRNAMDHGLETPEERVKNGKSKKGSLKLHAYHEGGQVNIDIIDDGKGINPDIIKEKAWSKGIINDREYGEISDKEAIELIFRPGFSTAEAVSNLSGRGVGMDVVKTNIEKLSGTVDIMSAVGRGSTFRLTLPLTVAIISSLIIEVSSHRFALPRVNLQEMVRIKPGDPERRIEYVQGYPVLRLRGSLLPIISLEDVLWKNHDDSQYNSLQVVSLDKVREAKKNDKRKAIPDDKINRVLVLKTGSRVFGVLIDKVHDDEEILVKPLPFQLKSCKAYSGLTIMGDGKVTMILDPEGIISIAGLRYLEEHLEKIEKNKIEEHRAVESQSILLFACSGEESFALDMGMISRVEEVSEGRIERIGDREYIQYLGEPLRVIRPENYLPVTKNDASSSKHYVIIPKHVAKPMGILVRKIEDSMQTVINLETSRIKGKGLLGSAIVRGKIVLFINIYDLLELASPEDYKDQNHSFKSEEVKTVLLVEDTPFFARMEKDYLEGAGYKVLLATNGREAMEVLSSQKVDLIVSDIEMPVMDGIELIKTIRSNRELSWIPAMAVTTLGTDTQIKKGIESGFDLYESKLDKIRFLEKVKVLAQKGREAV